MTSERERLLFEPEETAIRLWNITNEASNRLAGRILADERDLPRLDFPFGGREGLGEILAFMPQAKEGYAIERKSSEIFKGDTKKFLEQTSPVNLFKFEEEIVKLGIEMKKSILGEDGRTAVYRSSFVTVVTLSLAGRYGNENGLSEWPYRPDLEGIWRIFGEIELATRELLLFEDVALEGDKAIRAVHFFNVCSKILKAAI